MAGIGYKKSRPDVEEYFLKMAELVSTRSTCTRMSVGAVLTLEGHVIATGYNGAPAGEKHCLPYTERVRLSDGSSLAIGKIHEKVCLKGEEVFVKSFDFASRQIVNARVSKSFRNPGITRWLRIRTKGHGAANKRLLVSPDHEVYSETAHRFIPAKDLKLGDCLTHDIPSPTSLQKQILIGCSLGDGSVGRLAHWGAFLSFQHGAKQKEYARWKATILLPFSSPPREGYTKSFGKLWENINTYCRVHPDIAEIILLEPSKRVDHLEEAGLASWYQDDGCLIASGNTPHFCTYGWSKEEVEKVADKLCKKYGLHFRVVTRKSRWNNEERAYAGLTVCKYSKDAVFKMMAPFIHPSMQYKLPEEYRTGNVPEDPDTVANTSAFKITQSICEDTLTDSVGYDIQVENTHNFFTANGVLVSNCLEVGCLMEGNHCTRVIHAEVNTVAQAARHGHSTNNAVLYTTVAPCMRCTGVLINAGISKIICREFNTEYTTQAVLDMLRHAGVSLWQKQEEQEFAVFIGGL